MIRNLKDLCELVEAQDIEGVSRAIYKGTDCGAWVAEIKPGFTTSKGLPQNCSVEMDKDFKVTSIVVGRKTRYKVGSVDLDVPEDVLLYVYAVKDEKGYTITDEDSRKILLTTKGKGDGFTVKHKDNGDIRVEFAIDGLKTKKHQGGVVIGSIVEGCDFDADSEELMYPFTEKRFWEAVGDVESSASYIWQQTHGCEDCGVEGEWGHPAINPECKTCHGDGAII